MTRRSILALLLVFAACRGPAPAKPEGAGDAPKPPDPAAAQTLMQGKTNLYLYEADPTTGAQGAPRFEIRDTQVSLKQEGEKQVWSFQNAHAIIYGRDGAETHLHAGAGFLNEETKEAVLTGGVTMEMGPKTVQLEDIAWNNQLAKSDKPIRLRDGESEITASSLEYNPDTKELILKNAQGTLHYADEPAAPETPANAQAPAPAGEERSTNP